MTYISGIVSGHICIKNKKMVNFRIMSDLHLEFYPSAQSLYELIQFTDYDKDCYLILAGDVGYPVNHNNKTQPNPEYGQFLQLMSKQFQGVILVPGNHEYYRCVENGISIEEVDNTIRHICNMVGVIFLQNDTITIDNVVIHGCALFSHVTTKDAVKMHDIRYVASLNKLLSVYERHRQWVFQVLRKNTQNNTQTNNQKCLMITHHLPIIPELPPKFKLTYSTRMSAYCTDLLTELFDGNYQIPQVWCCGHIHTDLDCTYTFEHKKVRLITSPMGYIGTELHLTPTYFSL